MKRTDMIHILQTTEENTEEQYDKIEILTVGELQRNIRDLRTRMRKKNDLSRLQFTSERCNEKELKRISREMYAHNNQNTIISSMLCKFNLCVKTKKIG